MGEKWNQLSRLKSQLPVGYILCPAHILVACFDWHADSDSIENDVSPRMY